MGPIWAQFDPGWAQIDAKWRPEEVAGMRSEKRRPAAGKDRAHGRPAAGKDQAHGSKIAQFWEPCGVFRDIVFNVCSRLFFEGFFDGFGFEF